MNSIGDDECSYLAHRVNMNVPCTLPVCVVCEICQQLACSTINRCGSTYTHCQQCNLRIKDDWTIYLLARNTQHTYLFMKIKWGSPHVCASRWWPLILAILFICTVGCWKTSRRATFIICVVFCESIRTRLIV